MRGELSYSAGRLLGKFGDPSDVPRLIAAASRAWSQPHIDAFAAMIVMLSPDAILTVADETAGVKVRTAIASILTPCKYTQIRGHWINLLRSDNADLRTTVCRKISQLTEKNELISLLESYMSEGYHWFDTVMLLDEYLYAPASVELSAGKMISDGASA